MGKMRIQHFIFHFTGYLVGAMESKTYVVFAQQRTTWGDSAESVVKMADPRSKGRQEGSKGELPLTQLKFADF